MIGIIAPYSQFEDEIEHISTRLNIPVIIEVGALKTGLSRARKMIREHGVKVIIARGATADFLRKKLDIPIIKIDVTNFDVVKTLREAKKVDNTIIFIDHVENQSRIDLNTIKDILNVNIILKQYENENEVTRHINDVAEANKQIPIVGTAECMAKTARGIGIHSFIVLSQTDSMTESLLKAKESLEYFSKAAMKKKHLESIISYAFDGVISTDIDGIVTVCNDVAAKHIGIDAQNIIGSNIKNIQLVLFKKLVGDCKAASKKVIKNGSQKYVLNRVCLGEKSMVITFQEAEYVLLTDSEIRSELHHRRFYAKYEFEDIIFQSNKMKKTIELAKAYAKPESNILIYGKAGQEKN